MNPSQTQNREYWVTDFAISGSDIEQLYNHFLETEQPQKVEDIARVIIAHRVAEERNRIQKLLKGRNLYQPKSSYKVGSKLVFPGLRFSHGAVKSVRDGYDPQYGDFKVIAVDIDSKEREFASSLQGEHKLNLEDDAEFDPLADADMDELYSSFGPTVVQALIEALETKDEFVQLSDEWFVRDLMAGVDERHLHLTEAVLEVNDGGPLPPDEITVHLEMDTGVDTEVQLFSLNYALSQDDRFDEVGPTGTISWFLRRLEPEAVRVVPERLRYKRTSFDRALLSPQLLLLERELDDEWSELEATQTAMPTILSLTYPHRWAGTLPLSSRVRPLFSTGSSQRQRVTLVDEFTTKEMEAWVVRDHRYIYGLKDWYEKYNIPVGGFITLKPGPEAGIVLVDYDRRRPQREWLRLARVIDNQLNFDLERRSVGCGYDDLLIVGTDFVTAIDVLARRVEANQRSLSSLLIGIFPSLSRLNPQQTVHTKTLYSAINMIRRLPPGPLFAELIKHPAFQPVGDHYWQFDRSRA